MGEEMSQVCAEVLHKQVESIKRIEQQDKWFKRSELGQIQVMIREAFSALPMPVERLAAFESCRADYECCLRWLQQGRHSVERCNQQWTARMLEEYQDFSKM